MRHSALTYQQITQPEPTSKDLVDDQKMIEANSNIRETWEPDDDPLRLITPRQTERCNWRLSGEWEVSIGRIFNKREHSNFDYIRLDAPPDTTCIELQLVVFGKSFVYGSTHSVCMPWTSETLSHPEVE